MSVEISGKITINGVETEFEFDADNGSWSQWGGTIEELGPRVEYLEAMERGLVEHSDYFNQTDDEDEQEFPDGTRVVWTDPDGGQEHHGTVKGDKDEDDAYWVDFDEFDGDTQAYENELRAE